MKPEFSSSIQIAQLQYQSGQYRVALASAQAAFRSAQEPKNLTDQLEALRIQLVCLVELDRRAELPALIETIRAQLPETMDPRHLGTVEYLYAFIALNSGNLLAAEGHLANAIASSSAMGNYEILCHSIYAEAMLNVISSQQDYKKALNILEKVDLISDKHGLVHFKLSSLLLRCYIWTELGRYTEAQDLARKSYELATQRGLSNVVPAIYAQLCRLYRVQNDTLMAQVYGELALSASSSTEQPRLHHMISQIALNLEDSAKTDLEVDMHEKVIRERDKGVIYFGRQHILMDIAMLFLQNPGARFSKEEIFQKIWNEPYNPAVHDNLIYVSIKRLRAMLEPRKVPHYLLKDRGGYFFNPQSSISFKNSEELK